MLVEVPEPSAPYGVKGVGEPPTVVSTAAIVAALRDATGVRSCACRSGRTTSSGSSRVRPRHDPGVGSRRLSAVLRHGSAHARDRADRGPTTTRVGRLLVRAGRVGEPVTSGLHVAFVAPTRGDVDEFWRAGTEAGYRDDGAPGLAPAVPRGLLRLVPARPGRQQRRGGAPRRDAGRGGSTTSGSASRTSPRRRPSTRWSRRSPASGSRTTRRTACGSSAAAARSRSSTGRRRSRFTWRSRPTTTRPCEAFHRRRPRRATGTTEPPASGANTTTGYYGAFVLDPDGHNVEVVNHNR